MRTKWRNGNGESESGKRNGSCYVAEYCEMHQVSAGGGWSTN
jgi:hypothetical protein